MPYATPADLDDQIAFILNAATTWGGPIVATIYSPDAIATARKQSALEVLIAISKNPEHGFFGDLAADVSVNHDAFLPQHSGEIGRPKIVPYTGGAPRKGDPASPEQIDSMRLNPASYTGMLDGVVIPHDQPNPWHIDGAIVAFAVHSGGTGYVVGDTGTIGGTGTGATYRIKRVVAGVVTALKLTTRGAGYVVASSVATATAAPQAGTGTGLTVDITTVGEDGEDKKSPISCRFAVETSVFKFTGLSATIPMIVIDDTMRDEKIPLDVSPAVVKRAIPKLVKAGDPLYTIAQDYERDGKQDLVEITGGAMSVRPVKAVPDIIANLRP